MLKDDDDQSLCRNSPDYEIISKATSRTRAERTLKYVSINNADLSQKAAISLGGTKNLLLLSSLERLVWVSFPLGLFWIGVFLSL